MTFYIEQTIIGQWQFVNAYDGTRKRVEKPISERESSVCGSEILEFRKDNSFVLNGNQSNDNGSFEVNRNYLIMKYSNRKGTIKLNINLLNTKYLLLSGFRKAPHTWFYKKIK